MTKLSHYENKFKFIRFLRQDGILEMAIHHHVNPPSGISAPPPARITNSAASMRNRAKHSTKSLETAITGWSSLPAPGIFSFGNSTFPTPPRVQSLFTYFGIAFSKRGRT